MTPYLKIRSCKKNSTIFIKDQEAQAIFLLVSGSIELKGDYNIILQHSVCFGEEAAINAKKYATTATALQDCMVIEIPKIALNGFIRDNLYVKEDFYNLFSSRISKHINPTMHYTNKADTGNLTTQIVGWSLEVTLPVLSYFFFNMIGFDEKTNFFISILLGTTIMWIFSLLSVFIPPLFALMAILILGIAPPEIVLSGFSSSSFFLAMSILAITAALINSGLTFRVTLLILNKIPKSKSGTKYVFSLLGIGAIITSVLSSMSGRLQMMLPFVNDMKEILGYKNNSKESTLLALSVFWGAGLFSAIFLTGGATNLILFSLLPEQMQIQFQWSEWFLASIVAFVILFIGFIILTKIFFTNHSIPNNPRKTVKAQLNFLGKMSTQELLTGGGIILFMLGVVTSSIHKIDIAWVALFILLVFMTINLIVPAKFRYQVDWSFLILIGSMIGIMKVIIFLGLDIKISNYLSNLGLIMQYDFELFILVLIVLTFILRIALPDQSVAMILGTIFIPLANQNGVHPWIIIFCILMLYEGWYRPYQSANYIFQLKTINQKEKVFNEKLFLKFNLWVNLLKIIAIYGSIPFWRYLNLL